VALKQDLEGELKAYLKAALKKMMLFKKELKTDLMFTKEQCSRDMKMK